MFGILSGLLFGGAYAVSGVRCAIDNREAMSKPAYYLKDGTPVYHDRLMNTYINGEKTYETSRRDEFGNNHTFTIGCNSKRIYRDSHQEEMDRRNAIAEQDKQNMIKLGKLAYLKYDDRFKRNITTEISTGRQIATLYALEEKNIYRKFYIPRDIHKVCYDPSIPRDLWWCKNWPLNYYYWKPDEDDWGIPITKEEYDGLNIICGSHSKGIVSDKVIYKSGTDEDPYKDLQKKLQRRQEQIQRMKKKPEEKYYVCTKHYWCESEVFNPGDIVICAPDGKLFVNGKCFGNIYNAKGSFEEDNVNLDYYKR